MEKTTQALHPNAFALFNGIQTSSSSPDHGEAVLTIGPDSLNPYGCSMAAPITPWPTVPAAPPAAPMEETMSPCTAV